MANPISSYEVGPRNNIQSTSVEADPYAGMLGAMGASSASLQDDIKDPFKTYSSFAGSDILATIIIPGVTEPVTFATLRTVSYSLVRDKRPLRVLGSMNPICWSKSNRLIAGTLVFTSFDRYVWFKLTGNRYSPAGIVMADQLPPFDITITGINEYSQTTRMTIRGVRIVDEGSVVGVDDMYIELTHTYVAADIIPWIPGAPEDGGGDEGNYPAPELG